MSSAETSLLNRLSSLARVKTDASATYASMVICKPAGSIYRVPDCRGPFAGAFSMPPSPSLGWIRGSLRGLRRKLPGHEPLQGLGPSVGRSSHPGPESGVDIGAPYTTRAAVEDL